MASLPQLTTVKVSNLTDDEVLNLAPLASLPLLKELDISNNTITSTTNDTQLANMTELTSLDSSNTDLIDITPISQLTALVELKLNRIKTNHLAPLSKLTQLKTLILGTQYEDELITDLTFLTSLNSLKRLEIERINNALAKEIGLAKNLEILKIFRAVEKIDLNNFKELTELTTLDLAYVAEIYNLTAFNHLTKLNRLYFHSDFNQDISPTGNLTQLRSLDIKIENNTEQKPVSLSFLSQLPELNELWAYDTYYDFNVIADSLINLHIFYNYDGAISSENLSKLTKLTRLNTNGADNENVQFLTHMPKLKWLYLKNFNTTNYQPVATLNNLTTFAIKDSKIENVDPLKNLANLTGVYIRGNATNNVDALSNLTQLEWLWIYDTNVTDISSIANLTNLERLFLMKNDNLTDISALSTLTQLKELYLSDSPIVNIEPLFNLENLTILRIFQLNQIRCSDVTRLQEYFSNISDLTLSLDSCSSS